MADKTNSHSILNPDKIWGEIVSQGNALISDMIHINTRNNILEEITKYNKNYNSGFIAVNVVLLSDLKKRIK